MSGVEIITCLESEEEDSRQSNMVNDIYRKIMTFGEFHSLFSGLLGDKSFFFLVFSEELGKIYNFPGYAEAQLINGKRVNERENLPAIHQYAPAVPKKYCGRESENQLPNTVASGAYQ